MKRVIFFLLLVCFSLNFLGAEKQNENSITEWYMTFPYFVPKLAYGKESENLWTEHLLSGKKIDFKDFWPEKNSKDCKVVKTDKKNLLSIKGERADIVYGFLTYLYSDRWTRTLVTFKHNLPIAVYFDGLKKVECLEPKENQETKLELVLKRGIHRLGFAILVEEGKNGSVETTLNKVEQLPIPKATLSNKHPLSWEDVVNIPFVIDTEISYDGSMCALVLQNTDLEKDKRFVSLQLRDTKDGSLIFDSGSLAKIRNPSFDKSGKWLSFLVTSDEKGKDDIWIVNLETKKMELLLENVEKPKSLKFSPDASKLFFIANAPRKREDKKSDFDHITEMYQRWGDWRERAHLFVIDLKTKSLSQITGGESNLFDYSLSKDGTKVALLRGVFTTLRPYLKSEIYLYDLENFTSKKILSWDRWPDISEVELLKDNKTIAVMASKGDMPEGGLKPKEHLAYNLNLFLVDVETGKYECVTENFRPSLSSQAISVYSPRKNLFFNEKDNCLYFVATDKDRIRLYKMNVLTKDFFLIDFDDPVLSSLSLSFGGNKALYYTSALGKFWEVKIGDLETFETKKLWVPAEEVLARVKLGLLEPFDVFARDGEIIQGWLLYPPYYDKSKKYPLIVAYYGGVSPYGRAFRYEMFWLAGQGYIVYIVNPRGAVGYGQEFADAHCNDWGKEAGEDIIEGVKSLIKLRPSVDENKIGCFGGSYGGFMTLYLIGKSNLFSAAVDYFGISNIASYWGAGWWGFNYGDTAIPNSYPWTRKDIFVEQSPLFFADKINTPLLLLHGTGDTNVPSVESDQIFTALRVQNKKVEYVRFFNEDHGINSKPSVRLASEEMMLEWFDKYLKGEGEAWNFRWKDDLKPIEED